jgi:hypothetical protein
MATNPNPHILQFSPHKAGPLYLGAYHTHLCPRCSTVTTGTGASRCPECAWRVYYQHFKGAINEQSQTVDSQ